MERIFGYQARLVLEDDDGNEFEVAQPFTRREHAPALTLDLGRVLDAIHDRDSGAAPTRRPVY